MSHIFKVVIYFQLNSKGWETASSSNMQDDEAETCDGLSKDVIGLPKWSFILGS